MLNMPQVYMSPVHAGDGPSHLEHEVQSFRKQLADALAVQEQQRQQADTAQRHADSAAALLPGSQAKAWMAFRCSVYPRHSRICHTPAKT